MLVSEDGFDGLEIEWGTAAVDERLKHLFHVPAHLKDQVATVFDLIVAGRRCLDHADADIGQYQCAVDHDR